jgi:hypothetical protein
MVPEVLIDPKFIEWNRNHYSFDDWGLRVLARIARNNKRAIGRSIS